MTKAGVGAFLGVMLGGIVGVRSEPHRSEQDLLRGYAFASCLAEGYKGTSVEKDAEHVAGLYMEIGKTARPEVYERLRQAARAVHPEQRAVVQDANVAILICLDLYDSKAVRKIALSTRP